MICNYGDAEVLAGNSSVSTTNGSITNGESVYINGEHEHTNTNKTKGTAKKARALEVPKTIDCLQGILTVIPMQLLSMHIAELRKLDVRHDLFQCL